MIKKIIFMVVACFLVCGQTLCAQEHDMYLGIDIGGTSVKMAIFDENGKQVGEEKRIPTGRDSNPDEIINIIFKTAQTLKYYNKIKSVGVGMAAMIDITRERVDIAPNLPNWNGIYLKKRLQDIFNKPVYIDNDANVAALAICKNLPNVACVTLGTGVGGAIIINGKLYRGLNGKAAEFGHIKIGSDGAKCSCGGHGCVEAYIGYNAFMAYAKKYLITHPSRIVDNVMREEETKELTFKILVEAANRKDPVAIKILDYYTQKLVILLDNIQQMFDITRIELCGGIVKDNLNFFSNSVYQALVNRIPYRYFCIAYNNVEMGTEGAAILAKNEGK